MPPESPFVFDEAAPRYRISDDTLIAALKAYAKRHRGRAFSVAQFNAWKGRPCGDRCISRRFGSWRTALELAGVKRGRANKYSPEQLIEVLERAWRVTGAPPGSPTLKRLEGVTVGPYLRHWGSIKTVRALLARFHRGEITREQLLQPVGKKTPTRTGISPNLRWQIMTRDQHRCRACGKTADQGARLEVDHIQPVCKGGGNTPENLRTLCYECNRGKGAAA